MSVLDGVDVGPYRSIYVIANTPLFLFKRFREIETTRAISERHTAQDLVAAFNEHANKVDGSTDDDVIRAYLALIALSFVERHRAMVAAERLRMERLCWASRLLQAALATPSNTTERVITLAPPRASVVEASSTSELSTREVRIVSPLDPPSLGAASLIVRGSK